METMDLNLNELTSKELSTIGLFLRNDLHYNPHEPEHRKEILKKILLILEDRGEIDRLDAATSHKALQTAKYREISVFQPSMYVLSRKKINEFLQKNMRDFNLVKNWTKNYIARGKKN
jgi:hypothetical protein